MDFDSHQSYTTNSVNGHVFSLSAVADPVGGGGGVATQPPLETLGGGGRLGPVVETSGRSDPSSSYKCFPYIYIYIYVARPVELLPGRAKVREMMPGKTSTTCSYNLPLKF